MRIFHWFFFTFFSVGCRSEQITRRPLLSVLPALEFSDALLPTRHVAKVNVQKLPNFDPKSKSSIVEIDLVVSFPLHRVTKNNVVLMCSSLNGIPQLVSQLMTERRCYLVAQENNVRRFSKLLVNKTSKRFRNVSPDFLITENFDTYCTDFNYVNP